ncbi:heme biosynthesis protein HemY [Rhizobiaceae bacterium BDR2-2]|uniref:Heme biosynthesis protein HemY n=1 Tax=Ectorhizobium quercum TaxID=2965071 RepID=A0AAE3N407_9HYPH|nr:heme biosynthesis protein HemY [Ectorhizobium quercum]MCX8999254.1 heme biosynthesis protein HemY [Ectorhizobium quercum]
MIKLLAYAGLVLALGFGFSWLADRPGNLSIVWQGQLIEMSLMVAASIAVAFVAAVMIAWWLVRTVWTSPHSVRRFFRARKRDRGYQALSTGLIAAGAGNALLARKMAARSRGLLRADQEPLILLLDAQAALIEGKYDEARVKFEAMVRDPETRELGLRGLYVEARRLGANEAARQYAEQAAEAAPYLPWAAEATLEYHAQSGNWQGALDLLDRQKAAHVIEKPQAKRLKTVLLTAKARDAAEKDPAIARDNAVQALKIDKGFVPAALVAAQAYVREDNLRKAASVLEQAWKIDPHPEIAALYVRVRGGDSALDRLKRAERLQSLRPNHVESLFAVASAALAARDLVKARDKAMAAARLEPRESVFLLLADIEEAETGDEARIRHWMAQALKAPRDPAWVADGAVSEHWLPVSPVTGKLDAFEWKVPFGQLSGPVEEGSVSAAEAAFASLPPVRPAPASEKPEPAPAPAPPPKAAQAPPPKPQAEPVIIKPDPILAPAASTTVTDRKGEVVPFFGHAPDDPGVKKQPPADPAIVPEAAVPAPAKTPPPKPAPVPASAPAAPPKPAGPVPAASALPEPADPPEPFFGHPPDDPGVKKPDQQPGDKTRLPLF